MSQRCVPTHPVDSILETQAIRCKMPVMTKESRKVAMGADDANEVSVEGVAWVLDDSLWACFERANSHYLLFARSSNAP